MLLVSLCGTLAGCAKLPDGAHAKIMRFDNLRYAEVFLIGGDVSDPRSSSRVL